MPPLSKSEVQAAISAIIEREEREGIVSPEEISQRKQLWIRRNLAKHLGPVFDEVAERMGLDKNKINEAFAYHQVEVSQYLKEQQSTMEMLSLIATKITHT